MRTTAIISITLATLSLSGFAARAEYAGGAHGVRITAVVQAERIAGFTRTSNVWLQFQAMGESACAINGPAAMEGTRVGVSVIRFW